MFTWVDGHLVLALIVIPAFSVWVVGAYNARQVRVAQRCAERRQIFIARGDAR